MSGMNSAAKGVEELSKELSGGEESPEEVVAELDEPRMKEEYTFDFKYVDKRGRPWAGEFTNRILDLNQISEVGVLRARHCGGLPIETLDPATFDNSEMLAHCTTSLIKRPKWAANLGKLKDPALLRALYVEVTSHEDIFLGRGQDQEAGEGGKEDDQG
jgi:hypothetical protein